MGFYLKIITALIAACLLLACEQEAVDMPEPSSSSDPLPLSLQASTLDEEWSREWWLPRHEQKLADKNAQEINLVFIGDSITHGWEGESEGKAVWDEYYAPRGAFNLGFGGDRTENVLWRLRNGELDGLSPRLIVLLIGTNNTGHRMDSADDTLAGIAAITDDLRARAPEANILVLGIFPRSAEADDVMRQRNGQINAGLPAIAAAHDNIYFRNIGDVFLGEGGALSEEIMPDLLHLSPAAYRLWAEAIEPDIARLLGE